MSTTTPAPLLELVTIRASDVKIRPRRIYASVMAMHDEVARQWDQDQADAALFLDDDEAGGRPCELCGHAYGQKHRIVQGKWGGTYHPSNVVHLCPNHHAMIHLRVKYHQDPGSLTGPEWDRLDEAMHDPSINQLWASRVKAISIQRSIDRGTY